MKETIRQRALEIGFDACGFTSAVPPASAEHFHRWIEAEWHGEMGYLKRNAHKRIAPAKVLAGARTIVCLAASYHRPDLPQASSPAPRLSGVVARYARFADYHDILARHLKNLTRFLNELGGQETRSLWYVDTGPFLERDLAQRAGLGFVGKHTNLISRAFGNWLFLAEIITTLELEPDASEKNRCGTCARCLTACPTRAITAPFQLDARRCISYLTIELKGSIPIELRTAIGDRIYGCDDCLAVCPWNRFAKEGRLMREQVRADLDVPQLLELLELDEATFQRRFGGTPLARTKRRGLLRNVCVALGNSGDSSALPALERAADDPEPLIAEHACWAMQQITAREENAVGKNSPN
ncbi:MAG: tRNA epoxyqueuosine(34) reductase QueG [Verrucomicrobiales bacterium]|nr:tRNA epoxyqueuosine(34) reductase QueG [Verrucomicrobiales bacterium]